MERDWKKLRDGRMLRSLATGALMALTLGGEVKTADCICTCTDLSHEDVRRLIKAKALKSMPAVMQECGWTTPDGCAKCRPALNFYLLAEWPLDYHDDRQSRFVNERNHANIQKDGTYSVVPRMLGAMPISPPKVRSSAELVKPRMVKVSKMLRLFGT